MLHNQDYIIYFEEGVSWNFNFGPRYVSNGMILNVKMCHEETTD